MRTTTRQVPDLYKYTITTTYLRNNMSNYARILTLLPSDTKVLQLDAYEDWTKVLYNDQEGYVYTSALSTTKYTWRETFLRTYPASESNPSALIPAQSPVEVLSVTGEWSQVMYNDQQGYIFNYFLTDDGNNPTQYDFTYFHTDMTRFVNENHIPSPTINLLVTDLENKLTYVFVEDDLGTWQLLYQWSCTVGAPSTPTIRGTFYISGRKPYFGTDSYRAKYATRILGAYYYHTVLFNADGTEIIDDRLGMALSHGCIRLAVENAQWIYDTVLDATAVIID